MQYLVVTVPAEDEHQRIDF